MTSTQKMTFREVYENGGSHDYQSLGALVEAGFVRWDGSSQLYRTTPAGWSAFEVSK